MVLPVLQVSSTTSTRRPRIVGGGPMTRTGSASASFRVTTIDAKSHCRIEATTTPGMTPAFATPSTTSGSYSCATRSARARQSSPKSIQSTSMTPLGTETLFLMAGTYCPAEPPATCVAAPGGADYLGPTTLCADTT